MLLTSISPAVSELSPYVLYFLIFVFALFENFISSSEAKAKKNISWSAFAPEMEAVFGNRKWRVSLQGTLFLSPKPLGFFEK